MTLSRQGSPPGAFTPGGKDTVTEQPLPPLQAPYQVPRPVPSPCPVNLTRKEKFTNSTTSSRLSHFKRTYVGKRELYRVPLAK